MARYANLDDAQFFARKQFVGNLVDLVNDELYRIGTAPDDDTRPTDQMLGACLVIARMAALQLAKTYDAEPRTIVTPKEVVGLVDAKGRPFSEGSIK